MQTLKIRKSRLVPIIDVPPSKSYANRALILSSLKPGPVQISDLPHATDVIHLLEALKKIGVRITRAENFIIIENSFPQCEKEDMEIEVGEGGTTARFLACMLLLGKKSYRLILGERLAQRPWQEFIVLAQKLGAKVELKERILTVQGPATFPSHLDVDCSLTTQFATGLQLLSLNTHTTIHPLNMSSSQSYWRMTEEMLKHFRKENRYDVPKDWSSASYPLAFGALNQDISFPGLHYDSLQADAKFFDLLNELDCIEVDSTGLKVKKTTVSRSVHLDVSDCLDLVPTLGFFLSHIQGEHHLKGTANLVHKESDRLKEVVYLLEKFGRKTKVLKDELIIFGNTSPIEEKVDLVLPDDHRIVMAGTLFLLQHSGGSVTPSEAVKKSYPQFFDIFLSPDTL